MSRSTSIQAYRSLQSTSHFSELQEQILSSIQDDGPATRYGLSQRLDRRQSSICMPAKTLVDQGHLIEVPSVDPQSGKPASLLSLPGNSKTILTKVPRKQQDASEAQDPMEAMPTAREMLCSQLLKTQFTRVDGKFVAQALVGNIVFLVELTPVGVIK